jgi:hypothetical protein
MLRSSRRPDALLAAICLALATAVLAVPALAAPVHFEKESLSAYEGQLRHKQVRADGFHPGTTTGHLHVSLNDGRHMTVEYAVAQQARLVAQAHAANATVKVATLKAKKAVPVKHRLRYIAAGILVVVILIVLAVLLIGRRRTLAEEEQGTSGESAAS